MAYKIYLYDTESCCIGTGELSSAYLQYKLQDAQGQDIEVHISSMGGSAFDAVAIYNMLKGYAGKVTTIIDSIAASAAGTIFLAGSIRIISKYGLLMIHRPNGVSGGTSTDMQADIKMLDKVEASLVSIISDVTGLDAETVKSLVTATTWMTADEALTMGFATEIMDYTTTDTELAAVSNHASITKVFNNIPNKYHSVINKLLEPAQNNNMNNTDKELIEKTNGLLSRVLNYFKGQTVKTTTNKGVIKSIGALNQGVAVTNENDEDLADGDDYEATNAEGKKVTMSIKDGKVTNIKAEKDDAETDDDVKNALVLNRAGIKVTNKAEVSGVVNVLSGYQASIVEKDALIADLSAQLLVSNTAVSRDEATIKDAIKSTFTPEGSSRSGKAISKPVENFAPKNVIAQNSVKKALAAAGIK